MKLKKLAVVAAMAALTAIVNIPVQQAVAKAEDEYTYVENGWQYYTQSDTNVSKDFKRTPYIADIKSNAPANYYANAEDKSGSALKSSLKTIINTATTNYDWSRFEVVDEDPNNTSNVFMVYARASYGKNAHVSGNTAYRWNREHSYPQSKLSGASASDSLIIYADDWKTNGIRSNNPFGVVAHSTSNLVANSAGIDTANYTSGNLFEPTDAAKGEVARSTLYAYTLYGEPIEENFTSIALMLEWHLRFPVTTWEIRRNNLNYGVQKNRNPFIDRPEYACAMLKDSNTATQSTCANTTPIPMKGEDSTVNNVINLISAIGTVTYSSGPAIIAAEEAYSALTTAQKALVTNYQVLVTARSSFNNLTPIDQDVQNVILLIDAIGSVTKNSGAAIVAAENAYAALTEAQKIEITNYQTLLNARSAYDEILASQEIANNVINLINAIGTVTTTSEPAIIAAETAYYKLTATQKTMITNYQVLVASRQAYDDLTAPASVSYPFNFYAASSLSSTSGTAVTKAYFASKEVNGKGAVVSNLTITNNVRYAMNGGLTFGSGSSTGTLNLTFNVKINKIEIIGAIYDSGSAFTIAGATSTGALAAKGTLFDKIATPVTFSLSTPTNVISIASSSKRATIYQVTFYSEVTPLERLVNAITNADTCTDYINAPSYIAQYQNLSADDKLVFNTKTDDAGVNLYDKLLFMKTLYEHNQSITNNPSVNVSVKDYWPGIMTAIILISIFIGTIIVLEKKKYRR